jgi:S-DNA-T family DNA segregation ATPase FtsK/SpoIIIE
LAQAKRKRTVGPSLSGQLARALREGALFVLMAIAAYLFISLYSYDSKDPGWSYSGSGEPVVNGGGLAGAWFADVFLYLFGYLAYLFPLVVAYSGWLVFRDRKRAEGVNVHLLLVRWSGFIITLATAAALANLHFLAGPPQLPLNAGGVLGDFLGGYLIQAFSLLGSTLLLLALLLAGVTLATGLSWLRLMDATGAGVLALLAGLGGLRQQWRAYLETRRARVERSESVRKEKVKQTKRATPRIEPVIHSVERSERAEPERQMPLFDRPLDGTLPPLTLLDAPEPSGGGFSDEKLQMMSRELEMKLSDFGVEAQVVAVHPGPVITRFELQPAPGVKVSKISGLAKDLARALSTISVRVVEVIPGKSVIGLEIPNESRELVGLSEVLQSGEYDRAAASLTLALGKDISGTPVTANLAKMPHLLVAGTTGSGKSVAINAMILSLLFKAQPSTVRLILIDPKMLELSVYEGIPHLLTPVVTDMKEAANALRWSVSEMDRRYRIMASQGVRNITGYNRKVQQAIEKGVPIPDPFAVPDPLAQDEQEPATLQSLPYVVVVVDELADMMMIVGKKVEELIARLAQKARASGIHLILATQRPSVDVITGLIKANIPARIAFQVSARVDSRTILDQMGAEHLLGHGDMLYLAPGSGIPMRVHGAYVADQEVHRVVEYLKSAGAPNYVEEILRDPAEGAQTGTGPVNGAEDLDPLYDEALRIVTESRRASISAVQRRLKIGYNRAARMIEEMENSGVVGPLQPNGSREVLAPPPPEI